MIITYQRLQNIRQNHPNKKIVFLDGTFDLLSIGHIEILKKTKQFGDILVVGIMSDQWVREKKGRERPIRFEDERVALIDAVRYVDYSVLLNDQKENRRVKTSVALGLLKPDLFVSTDNRWLEKKKDLEELGIGLKIARRGVPPIETSVHPISTTGTIERIIKLYKKDKHAR